jgi:acetyl esterase
MPLDPTLQGILALVEMFGPPPMSAGTPDAARRALRSITVDASVLGSHVPVADVRDRVIRVDRRRLVVRTYRPARRRAGVSHPTIVFLHGGGFVIGDLDTHDNLCRRLCREVDAVVVSVDYRVAPEHPFPAAVEDALAATRWVSDHVARLGGDRDRVAIAGDSAGGNLAAVVTQAWVAAEDERPPLAGQLLLYPVVDLEDDDGERYPSRLQHAEGYLLAGDDLRWFADHYLGDAVDRRDPRMSPLHGDLAGLPPAVVVSAEFDPLRDEAEAYAAALRDAGVPVVHRRFDGLIHGFFDLAALSPAAASAAAWTCAAFREALEVGAEG